MNRFFEHIDTIQAISLFEMDSVALQNRLDKKYLLSMSDLSGLLPCLIENYRILTIEGENIFTYENQYFDTPDFQFYSDHHNGYIHRIKVRTRRYVESNLFFFEIKKKEKINRTVKYRKEIEKDDLIYAEEGRNQIRFFARKDPGNLINILQNNFQRITLVNKLKTERVTIDFNLCFSNDNTTREMDDFAVIEIKHAKSTGTSPLVNYFRKKNIREQNFSKYVVGVISLFPEIKKNNFLPILKSIQKIHRNGRTNFSH